MSTEDATEESSLPLIVLDEDGGYRRRSTRRRIPKIEWGHEDAAGDTSKKGGHSKGFSSNSKSAERKRKIPTDDSSQRENSERKRSYEKGKSSKTAASPVIAPGVDGITGYTIPPSIFNDIPDIDLCTLMETSTTATSTVTARKRHSKHQILSSLQATKVRKMMKNSDGCSSNSGSGSEASYTDGVESDQVLQTDETMISSSKSNTISSKTPPDNMDIQMDGQYHNSNSAKPPTEDNDGITSKPLVSEVTCIKSDLRLWEKDVSSNSTVPPILWALDNIPDKLQENKEWIHKIEEILLKWNSLPHSTKIFYMNKASENQQSAAKVSTTSLDKDNLCSTFDSPTSTTPSISSHSTTTINHSTSITNKGNGSSSSTYLHTSVQSPVNVVSPPVSTMCSSLYHNLPVPLLAATLMGGNVSLPLLQGTPLTSPSYPTLPMPFNPMSIPMPSPSNVVTSASSSSNSVTIPFSNALKLFATVPFTMPSITSSSGDTLGSSSSAVPIFKVENPICSSGGTVNHLVQPLYAQPLHNITEGSAPCITTSPSITETPLQNVTGTLQSTSGTVNDTQFPSTATTATAPSTTGYPAVNPINSNFCINNILGGGSKDGTSIPSILPLETKPIVPPFIPPIKANGHNAQTVRPPKKKNKKWPIFRVNENPPLMPINKINDKATVVSCTSQFVQQSTARVTTATSTAESTTQSPSTCISSSMDDTIKVSQQQPKTTSISCSSNDLSLVSDDWRQTFEKQVREQNTFKKSKRMASSNKPRVPLHGNNNSNRKQLKNYMNRSSVSPFPMAASSPTVLLSPSEPFMGAPSPIHHQQVPLMKPLSRSSSSTSLTSPTNFTHNMPPPFPSPAANTHQPFRYPVNLIRSSSNSPMTGLVSPTVAAPSPFFTANPFMSPDADSHLKLFDPMSGESKRGLNLSVEDQAKLDARNYASLERQYWRMLVAFEELKKSIASMKERMMKARIQQQIILLNDEKYHNLKDLVVNPILDPSVPDLLESPLKGSTVSDPSKVRLKGTFDKPVLENEDIYKYLLQSRS